MTEKERLFWQEIAHQVVDNIDHDEIIDAISPAIIRELRKLLRKPEIQKMLREFVK